jgi:hypothetical protein
MNDVGQNQFLAMSAKRLENLAGAQDGLRFITVALAIFVGETRVLPDWMS